MLVQSHIISTITDFPSLHKVFFTVPQGLQQVFMVTTVCSRRSILAAVACLVAGCSRSPNRQAEPQGSSASDTKTPTSTETPTETATETATETPEACDGQTTSIGHPPTPLHERVPLKRLVTAVDGVLSVSVLTLDGATVNTHSLRSYVERVYSELGVTLSLDVKKQDTSPALRQFVSATNITQPRSSLPMEPQNVTLDTVREWDASLKHLTNTPGVDLPTLLPTVAADVILYVGRWGESQSHGYAHAESGTAYLHPTGQTDIDARLVAHELGHLIGLPHVHNCRDVMYPTPFGGDEITHATRSNWRQIQQDIESRSA